MGKSGYQRKGGGFLTASQGGGGDEETDKLACELSGLPE